MEIKYVPFLKSKPNEIHALSEMASDLTPQICPFFDYPKKQNGDTEIKMERTISGLAKKFGKYLQKINSFYFDIYDINDDLEINGKHIYAFVLEKFASLPMIPVVGIDRSHQHQASVVELKKNGLIVSDVIAFRVTQEDFQNFHVVKSDIEDILHEVFSLFEGIDLIFDCRICTNADTKKIAGEIANFSDCFCKEFPVRNIIISGSSVPASVAEVLSPNSEDCIQRIEIDIYKETQKILKGNTLVFGDYTTISPDYSDADIPPQQMQNRITARLTYSFNAQHYFIRGGSLKTKGREQYFDLAATLCGKPFFRHGNSPGDLYFEEKSKRQGDKCYVNTVIKPSINSHMTYMVQKISTNGSI
ncbi:hypothetical protein ABC502_16420 [Alkalimonas sp. NCh-2]|uniref:beta family protein n=1 Tax=Alkalimonas sp. NCh-2 TaxID=3144846 RepID=UPI0031F69FE4